jgi:multidrug resistance efflux pump
MLALAFAQGVYRVGADARLEGRVQRAIVATMDGFVAEAHVRAGDTVEEGQILARLDDGDLQLERVNGSSRLAQLESEYREALGQHDRSRASILRAQMDQVGAEQSLVDARIARTALSAPFSGVVVAGDLSQRLGSPVARGDVLFEVAPQDGYRIILRVDERDITALRVGQAGRLRLSALPNEELPFSVRHIQPVTVAEDGLNHFRVEAHLQTEGVGESARRRLRPGMEGAARVEVGERPLLWIWTHRAIDTLRLGAWRWW